MTFTMVIADDEFLSLKSEEMFVKKEFPNIEIIGTTDNGIDLKKMLEKMEPDIAMIDIRMPGLTGIEVIELLRHKGCKTHFIINTAYSDFDYVKSALNLKTDGYLLKPGKREEILDVISRLCRTVENEKKYEEKQNRVEAVIQTVTPVIGSEILMSVFLDYCDEENFKIYCDLNNINFTRGCIVTFLPKSQDMRISKKNLNAKLSDILTGICNFLSTVSDHNIVIMIFVPEEIEQNHLKSWCDEIARLVSHSMEKAEGVSFLYGIGNVYNAFPKMVHSYKESIQEFSQKEETYELADKSDQYIEKAKVYVQKHFREDISLDNCAQCIGISSYYLSHIFKQKSGKTFVEYLSMIRIEEAKRLTLQSSFSIKEIAERCGYYNLTYFYKVFKKSVGVTIGEFKKK